MNNEHEEKLYFLNGGIYIQYNGEGEMPDELASYINKKGTYPPFMPLPSRNVDFRIDRSRNITWSGKGELPEAILNYVKENGFLPHYNDGIEDDFENQSEYELDGQSEDSWSYH